ncbi:MAG: CDP-alcohol phosphatidyltransferase family protein [Calditrichaceae bacterium]|jgi:CDP-diacylglycerol---glycerol-3-phosphate 3-phosphatidyltransferase
MGDKNRSLLPIWLQDGFVNLLTPLVKLFTKWELNPNYFTIWGLIITSMATVILFGWPHYIHLAGAFILIGGICDILDGKLARTSGRVTRFGALFDSSVDRYSEVIMFFGIAAYYVRQDNYVLSVVAFVALGGSTMVSYVRARAEALGFEAKVGLMQRPERVVLIGSGAFLYFKLFDITIFHVTDFPVTLLEISLWMVAIFANYTAIHRLVHVYKQDNAKSQKEVQ